MQDLTFENLRPRNMSDVRRMLPFAGGLLILMGVLQHKPIHVLLASLGGVLVYRGLTSKSNGVSYEKGTATLAALEHAQGVRIEQAVTIKRSPEDLYRFWRNLENLPRVMSYLESVRQVGPTHSHWVAKAPAGLRVEWDAETIQDVPSKRIGWRSLDGADIPNAGSVRFEPLANGLGTVVYVNLKYDVPAGQVGMAFAKLLGSDPNQMIQKDLQRLKAFMEMG